MLPRRSKQQKQSRSLSRRSKQSMLRGRRFNAWLEERDCDDLVLELAPDTKTGYKYVKTSGEKFQAFVYDEASKAERNLPGRYDTAEKAAKARAIFIKLNMQLAPAKPRAPRGSKGAPLKLTSACRLPRMLSHRLLVRVVRSCRGPDWSAEEAPEDAARRRQKSYARRECLTAKGAKCGQGRPGGRHGPRCRRHSGACVCSRRACEPAGYGFPLGGCCVRLLVRLCDSRARKCSARHLTDSRPSVTFR